MRKIKYITFTLVSIIVISAWANNDVDQNNLSGRLDDTIESLYNELSLDGKLDREVFNYAMIGHINLKESGKLKKDSILTIIDFHKPSTKERLFVIHLKDKKILYSSLVAHGRNTGANMASDFSNEPGSLKSSLGFFITSETYVGKHGYSMRLKGVDPSYNDNAEKRAIVVHGADYVTKIFTDKHGRLGRSWGCPALPPHLSRPIIDIIKDGSCLFIYYPDREYLNESVNLDIQNAIKHLFENSSL